MRPEAKLERKINGQLDRIYDDSGNQRGLREQLLDLLSRYRLDRKLPILERLLKRKYVNRYEVKEQVEVYGPKAIPILAKRLKPHNRLVVRLFCAGVLGELASPKALPALEEALLNDPESRIRACAAGSIVILESPSSLPALIKALRSDSSPEVRSHIATYLYSFIEMGALPQMLSSLKNDPDPEVRSALVHSLVSLPGPRLVDPSISRTLLEALESEGDTRVRCSLVSVIASNVDIDDSVRNLLAGILKDDSAPEVRSSLIGSLYGEKCRTCLPILLGFLKDDPNPKIRESVLETIFRDPAVLDAGGVENVISAFKNEKNPGVRYYAVRILGRIRSEKAVPELLAFLEARKDDDSARQDRTRDEDRLLEAVFDALTDIKGAAIIPELKKLLDSPQHKYLRYHLIASIGKFQTDEAFEILSESLRNGKDISSNPAISMLGSFKRPETVSLLEEIIRGDHPDSIKLHAMRSLVQIDKKAVKPFLKDFISRIGDKQEQAQSQLVELLEVIADPETEPFLTKILLSAIKNPGKSTPEDVDSYRRRTAANALGKIGGDSAAASLKLAFEKEPDPSVRLDAFRALAGILGDRARDMLCKALTDDDMEIRKDALRLIGNRGDDSFLPNLISVFNTATDRSLRRDALRLIGIFNNGEAKDILVAALGDGDLYIRRLAIKSLVQRCEADMLPAILSLYADNLDSEIREDALDAIGNFNDPAAHKVLVETLKDPRWQVRGMAVEALGKTGRNEAVPVLMSVFKNDPIKVVKVAAAKALGSFDCPDAYEFLVNALDETDAELLVGVISALGTMGNTDSVPILLKMLVDGKYKNIQGNIIDALGEIGNPQAVAPLLAYAEHAPDNLIYDLCVTFGNLGDPRATDFLAASLDLNPQESFAAAAAGFAMAKIRDPRSIPNLEALLSRRGLDEKSNEDNADLAAACTLAFMGRSHPQSIPVLKKYLGSHGSWDRFVAACALLRLGTAEAMKELEALKDDEDREIRRLAKRMCAGEGISSLKYTLHCPDETYRGFTVGALVFMHATEFLSDIEKMARTDQSMDVREAARHAARQIRNKEK